MVDSFERILNPSLHIGFEDGQVVIDIVVENLSDEDLTLSGRWSQMMILDEDDSPRLESMATTCVVKNWNLDAGKALHAQRRSETPEMIREDMEGYEGALTFTPDKTAEDREERVYYAPNIDPEADGDERFTAQATIRLSEYSIALERSFTLNDLDAPADIDSMYDVMESPRVEMNYAGFSGESTNPVSGRYVEDDDDT